MPSIKLKRTVKISEPSTARVLVRKPDNVITGKKKLRMRPKQEQLDTSVVDQEAKTFSADIGNNQFRTFQGFAVTGCGPVLGTTGVTATRWVKSGLLPKPIFQAGRADIYHLEEVRSFFRILSEHQKDHKQYKPEHADIRRRLFEENARIRTGLFPTK